MLISLHSLHKYAIVARDGELGHAEQFLFDDDLWTVRYLVVKPGRWLTRKEVLVSPISVRSIGAEDQAIRVSLTRKQVEQSPDVDTERPVSRQWEAAYNDYYRWPNYWNGSAIWGVTPYPGGLENRLFPVPLNAHAPQVQGDPHLRSTQAVRGYGIEATDHRFGHIADFVIDDENWRIRYLVVDTTNFWPGKSVLISPAWVESISWADRRVRINLNEETIKNSPLFQPGLPIGREYEESLWDYYHRPRYWTEEARPPSDAAASNLQRWVY